MSRSKELIKNTFIILVGRLFTQFLSFFLLPLYTRLISASDYGTVDLYITYINLIAPIVTLQQEMATFRYLVDARNDEQKKTAIISSSVKSTFVRLMLFSIVFLLISLIAPSSYKNLALLAGIFVSFSNLFLQVARGLGKNVIYSIGTVIAGIVTVVSNLVFICILGWGGESILLSMILANIACSTYLFFSLKIFKYLNLKKAHKTIKKAMLRYSLPLIPNGISWWLINASDRTIVSIFLGVAANGIYAVANKFPAIVSGLLGIFNLSWTESASLHIDDNDRDEFFSGVAEHSFRLLSSACLGLIAVLPFIFNIVIGEEYVESYNYIPIFIIAALFNGIVSIYSAVYVAKKDTKKVATTSAVSAVINIIVDLALIHFIGLYAAAISTLLAYLVMAVYRHFDIQKYAKIRYNIKGLIFAALSTAAVVTLYYFNSPTLNTLSLAIAVVYVIIQNKDILKKLIPKH